MQRNLSAIESIFVGREVTPCAATTTRGRLDHDAMARAFELLTRAHPTLRAHVEQDVDHYVLCVDDSGPAPQLEVLTGEHAQQDAFNPRFPLGGPLIRATLLPGADSDTLYLMPDHTISDGRSVVALMTQFWQTYTALLEGGELPRAATELPPAADGLVRRDVSDEDITAFVDARRGLAEETRPAVLPPLPLGPDGKRPPHAWNAERIAVPVERLPRLIAAGRAQGVSLHGTLTGAILAALAETAQPGDERRQFSTVTTVDIRDRLNPPLPASTMVYAAAGITSVVEVPEEPDVFAIGRAVVADVRAGVERGDLERTVLAFPQLLTIPPMPVSLAYSNIGRLSAPPTPAGVDMLDLRSFGLAGGTMPIAMSGTFGNQLTLEFIHSTAFFGVEQIRALAESVRNWLGKVSAA